MPRPHYRQSTLRPYPILFFSTIYVGVDHVYQTLHREIIELTIEPGNPIDELQLATRFSMSCTPIREALKRLATEELWLQLTMKRKPIRRAG